MNNRNPRFYLSLPRSRKRRDESWLSEKQSGNDGGDFCLVLLLLFSHRCQLHRMYYEKLSYTLIVVLVRYEVQVLVSYFWLPNYLHNSQFTFFAPVRSIFDRSTIRLVVATTFHAHVVPCRSQFASFSFLGSSNACTFIPVVANFVQNLEKRKTKQKFIDGSIGESSYNYTSHKTKPSLGEK